MRKTIATESFAFEKFVFINKLKKYAINITMNK